MFKLKPCPFCGKIKTLRMEWEDNGCGGHVTHIACFCGAHGPWVDHSKEKAVELWNKRTKI